MVYIYFSAARNSKILITTFRENSVFYGRPSCQMKLVVLFLKKISCSKFEGLMRIGIKVNLKLFKQNQPNHFEVYKLSKDI